uniref:Kinin-1 n=1 Tax=Periplaneta americana TaxID=6978 RepID=KINI1_PERAM|nr:RecName: Full=Kinin-1; AltName: Full=Pea-K-1 [Periplaneta americana]
RPSFNSWG